MRHKPTYAERGISLRSGRLASSAGPGSASGASAGGGHLPSAAIPGGSAHRAPTRRCWPAAGTRCRLAGCRCGCPLFSPSSVRIPAFRNAFTSARTRLSFTRRAPGPSRRCGRSSRTKPRHTTRLEALPASVRVTRRCHPFEGRVLAVLGGMRRHGVLELLVVLPDGSKALMPAGWTDMCGDRGRARCGHAGIAGGSAARGDGGRRVAPRPGSAAG